MPKAMPIQGNTERQKKNYTLNNRFGHNNFYLKCIKKKLIISL